MRMMMRPRLCFCLVLCLAGSVASSRDFPTSSNEVVNKSSWKIGSRPPSCEHKCYGCNPCEAIQVPTTAATVVGVQYTNYEPEGWKCKCGPTFYTP